MRNVGRPKTIDPIAVAFYRKQKLSLSQIAKKLGCSKSAVSKTLRKMELNNPLNKSELTQEKKLEDKVD